MIQTGDIVANAHGRLMYVVAQGPGGLICARRAGSVIETEQFSEKELTVVTTVGSQDRRLDELKAIAEQKRREADAADQAVTRYLKGHCQRHPLTEAQQRQLKEGLLSDKALCCKAGREFLSTVVDPIWAELLNGWAYEELSCTEVTDEDRERFSRKLDAVFGDYEVLFRDY